MTLYGPYDTPSTPGCSPSARVWRQRVLGFFILGVSLVLSGCPKPFGPVRSTGPLEIRLQQENLTLAWDHSGSAIPHSQSAVDRYRLYFREQGSRLATMVAEVRSPQNPTFMISADEVLGARAVGAYEFGVSSVTRRGEESPIHWSTDYSARPRGGWYVYWSKP